MLSSKMYWGYLTSATQMVQPPALSQIGLSLNNNSAFAFVGSLTDIVSYCCKHSRTKIVLQRASSNSREVDDQTNTIEVQVKHIRTIYSVMNPLSSIMVILRPHSVQTDVDNKRKNRRKRFTLPATSDLLELAVGLNQMFDRSFKHITNFTSHPHTVQPQSPSSGLRARSGTTSLLAQSTNNRQLPDDDIDLDLPIYTAEPDGQAGGFSTLIDELLPPPYEAILAA